MEIKLIRDIFTDTETLGKLFIDDVFFCYTLEDKFRHLSNDMSEEQIKVVKVQAQTAIPKGRYRVILSLSNRFKTLLPEVLNVKGFAGIRIHGGNDHTNSEGCILVAENRFINKQSPLKKSIFNWIQKSKIKDLNCVIQKAINKSEKVFINII